MANGMHRTRRVVLLMAPAERMFTGIGRYAETVGNWAISLLPAEPESVGELRESPPDGLIIDIDEAGLVDEVGRLGRPIVNVSGALHAEGIAQVCCDSLAAGALAAEHFLDHGFQRFAFVGDGRSLYGRQRESGFRRRLREEGHAAESLHVPGACATHSRCTLFQDQEAPSRATARRSLALPIRTEESPSGGRDSVEPWETGGDRAALSQSRPGPGQDQVLLRWLRALPSATAIFAATDHAAWWVTEAAAKNGISVPDELAVLGMGDHGVCRLSRPPLSSIQVPIERIGFVAAEQLEARMSGETACRDVVVAPLGVARRRSTDVLGVEDERLAAGLRFIHSHYAEAIRVTDVARAAGITRRTLEQRFRKHLGRTPAAEIRRARVDAARDLLATTDLPIDDVAARSGFSSRRWLNAVLSDATGLTPSAYRRSVRLSD